MQVRACAEQDIDPNTYECSHEVWIDYQQPVFEQLTVDDGMLISAGLLTVAGTAYAFKLFRKFLQR